VGFGVIDGAGAVGAILAGLGPTAVNLLFDAANS
jgi:hypothetical protein